MNSRGLFFLLVTLVLLNSCGTPSTDQAAQRSLAEWVNPFIGTGGHGHTYPGATRPFGMVQLSPDTRLDGWDGCSGYHDSDSLIYGFSHTHLQGTGVSDYGDLLIMPTNNSVHQGANWGERYRSAFKKSEEEAHAGYYKVHLDDHALTAELTATSRVGVHRYTFDKADTCVLFFDMEHRDELLSYMFEPVGDTLIIGYRQSKAWAENQIVYFAASFSAPFEFLDQTYELLVEEDPETGEQKQTMEMVPVFPLNFGFTDSLLVKVALSSTSVDGALNNLKAEAPHWSFSRYRADAEAAWNEQLGKIAIETPSENDKSIFYTALYHSYTTPNLFSDVDGTYRGTDFEVHSDEHGSEGAQYTVFSLWDTFRATHPLYTITEQKRSNDLIRSMLRMYQQGGKLPMWELGGNYTGCMIGYHSVPVIVDAYMKGIRDFDHDLALEAMLATARADELGKRYYGEKGYLAAEAEHESVSKTLEYAYNDWCIARFAEAIGADSAIVREFDRRALSYRNLFNPASGFIQPRRGASFIENFNPREVNFNYTEANGWQYNFFTPHDVNGHIELLGGDEAYAVKLDEMFSTTSKLDGRDQADITGLIGQYAHGNEPSHHMAYLYPFVGQAWKTQDLVKQIMDELYHNAPDGLSGNEDCGQMSSWYVLSALGFYPVCPGDDRYIFGTPRFDEASITLENGAEFRIRAVRENPESHRIQRVSLNGEAYSKSYIRHQDILAGGELVFYLGDEANKDFAAAAADRPQHRTLAEDFVAVPIVYAPRTFRDSCSIDFDAAQEGLTIHYAVTKLGEDTTSFETFTGQKIYLDRSARVHCYAALGEHRSAVVFSDVVQLDPSRSIEIVGDFDNQYAAGGPNALIDGIRGGDNFKTGEWQGYFGTDVQLTVDLGQAKTVNSLSLGTLQDIKPWIWSPRTVRFSYSLNGSDFLPLKTLECGISKDDYTPQVYRFVYEGKKVNARYLRAEVDHFGTIPDWHLGEGNPSWLFMDEFEIETR